jgi:pimeloyl-ACP methyl ester carboxylesterase
MEAAMSYDREMPRALEELRLPVIAINPDDRPTDIASMARCGVEVVLMPGVGHFPHLENPARFDSILSPVIERFL